MKYVMLMGYVYRLTERRYRQLLRSIAREEAFDLDQLGRQVCSIAADVTDMDPQEAEMHLNYQPVTTLRERI